MCNDPVWMKWLAVVSAGAKFSTDVPGISYMLAGDAGRVTILAMKFARKGERP